MLTSRLTKKIIIEKQKKIPDFAGGNEIIWQEFRQTHAEIIDVLDRRIGNEKLRDFQISNSRFFYITIRFDAETYFQKNLRIIYGDRIFKIHQTINENCERNESLRFFVEERT